jgi:hypothetical protein
MREEAALSSDHRSVSEICACLHRAYRDLRFYPPDHPTARQALDVLGETVISHVNARGPLTLEVEEGRLTYAGQQVYSYQTSRDNLAFLLFRDGIRSLSLYPGLEAGEVEVLVDRLAHADDLADAEHDLATALWEQDFAHIDYHVADPFLGGEVLREGTIDALRETVLRRLDEVALTGVSRTGAPAGGMRPVERTELDAESLALTQTEIEQSEQAATASSTALEDFTLVLLEMAGDSPEPSSGDDALIRSLSMVIDHYLENRNLEGLSLVLDRLQRLEVQGRRPAGFVGLVVGGAVTAEHLVGLLEGIGQAPPDEAARIDNFLGTMRRWAIPALLQLLGETDDRAVRKMVLAVLLSDDVPGQYLWPLMQDSRWYVVRNAVQLAAGSLDPDLAGHLERLLHHPEVRVRREVMRTLDASGGDRDVQALVKALNDEDSSVRTLAARSLGRHGAREHEATVLAHVESRDFDTRPTEEVEALLGAFARVGGERAVAVLDKLWRRRRFSAHPLPVRLAALQALGAVSSPAAERALKEAMESGEAQLQRTAVRALHEAQALRTRPRA